MLIASAGDPAQHAIVLRALCQHSTAADSALVVTTTESAAQTIDTYETLCSKADRPALGVVDTLSEHQSISALYDEIPVIFIPSPGDLERLVIALSDLARNVSAGNRTRHLGIQSLTPILETTSTSRVCTVLDRIAELRSETGLCLLGLDYTAHDQETMTKLTEHVDGIIWAERIADRIKFDYQPVRQHQAPATDGDTDD